MRTVTIDSDVREVLERSTFAGVVLKLPEQLDRALYVKVNKTLGNLGASWDRKAGGHVFAGDSVISYAVMMEGGKVPPRNPLAFYPTPQEVVHAMLAAARLDELPSDRSPLILEPSAGDGAIALEVVELVFDAEVHCVEIDKGRADALRREPRLRVWEGDFLAWQPAAAAYDRVLMNPPFRVEDDSTAWLTHVRRALALLAPDGILVSVVPNGYLHRVDKKHTSFRNAIADASTATELEADAFADAGTGVSTVILTIDASALKT